MKNRDLAIGAALLLLFLKGKSASASEGPVRSGSFADEWDRRVKALLKRAKGGDAWVPRMTLRLGSPEAGAAAGRWIGIESGGDPRNTSTLDERGLAQVSKQSLAELGLTDADFAAMDNARTTDDQHADFAAAVMSGELIAVAKGKPAIDVSKWGPRVGPVVKLPGGRTLTLGATPAAYGIGVAKLRHGLPLFLSELRAEGLVRDSIPATLAAVRASFKPSPRLAAFAGGTSAIMGVPSHDLALRFLAPVAVVAAGDAAIGMGASGSVS